MDEPVREAGGRQGRSARDAGRLAACCGGESASRCVEASAAGSMRPGSGIAGDERDAHAVVSLLWLDRLGCGWEYAARERDRRGRAMRMPLYRCFGLTGWDAAGSMRPGSGIAGDGRDAHAVVLLRWLDRWIESGGAATFYDGRCREACCGAAAHRRGASSARPDRIA